MNLRSEDNSRTLKPKRGELPCYTNFINIINRSCFYPLPTSRTKLKVNVNLLLPNSSAAPQKGFVVAYKTFTKPLLSAKEKCSYKISRRFQLIKKPAIFKAGRAKEDTLIVVLL